MPLKDISEYGGWQYSHVGGANYIPPRTFMSPMRGSQGVQSAGLPSIFPDMPQLGPLGNMGAQMAGYFLGQMLGIDPKMMQARKFGIMESEYGAEYLKQQQQAMTSENNVREIMAKRMLHSRFQGQNLRAPAGTELNVIDTQAKQMASSVNWAARLSPLLGLGGNEVIKELYPEQQVFEGMQLMSGAALLPRGGAAAGKFAFDLIDEGKLPLPFGYGGRAEIFKSLAARGLLPGTQSDLMTGTSSGQVKERVKQFEQLASKARDVFGSDKAPGQLLELVDEAMGGTLAGAGPAMASRLVEDMRASIFANRLPSAYVSQTAAQAAQAAQAMGMVGAVGTEAAIAGINMGQQVAQDRKGRMEYGQRSAEELSGIYTRRILAGRASSFAMVQGGVMASLEQEAERRGINVDNVAGDTPYEKAVSLARAVGAPDELITQLGNLNKGGQATFEATKYFSPANTATIANQLVQAGVGPSETAFRDMMTTYTRRGEAAAQKYTTAEGLLEAQKQESLRENVMPQIRRTIAEVMPGASDVDLAEAMTKVEAFYSNPANAKLSGRARNRALAAATGGVIDEQGAGAINMKVNSLYESSPMLASFGGMEEALTTDPKMVRQRMTKALEQRADQLRAQFGPDTFSGRIIEDLMSAPSERKESVIAKYLGSRAKDDTGELGKGYAAFSAFMDANKELEAFMLDPTGGEDTARQKELQANVNKSRAQLEKWTDKTGTPETKAKLQEELTKAQKEAAEFAKQHPYAGKTMTPELIKKRDEELKAKVKVSEAAITEWEKRNPVAAAEARKRGAGAKGDGILEGVDEVTITSPRTLNITATASSNKNVRTTYTKTEKNLGSSGDPEVSDGNEVTSSAPAN